MTDRELINLAMEAAARSYVPYSRMGVGAAIECDDGTVVTGCAVENRVQRCTACAEQAAALSAVSGGHNRFQRIAIWSNGPDYRYPCGLCRQILSEFSPSMEVLSVRGDGRYVSYRLSDLLPFSSTGFYKE